MKHFDFLGKRGRNLCAALLEGVLSMMFAVFFLELTSRFDAAASNLLFSINSLSAGQQRPPSSISLQVGETGTY